MNDKIIYFTQIVFYLDDSIKEIFIDYIEEDSEFLSIDFSKVERNYWFCKLIFKSRNIKQKFLKKINDFRKNFKLLSLKSSNDNNISINEIYFEEFENKDWLGENVQTLRPINIKNFIIYDNDNFKLFDPRLFWLFSVIFSILSFLITSNFSNLSSFFSINSL